MFGYEQGAIVKCTVTGVLETGLKYRVSMPDGREDILFSGGLVLVGQETQSIVCDGRLYHYGRDIEHMIAAVNQIQIQNSLEQIDIAHFAREQAERNQKVRLAFKEIREALAESTLRECFDFVIERLTLALNIDGLCDANLRREDYVIKQLLVEYDPESVKELILDLSEPDVETPETPVYRSFLKAVEKSYEVFPASGI